MNALPLPTELFDRAVAAGITQIALNFSGGSDEGYLYVNTDPSDTKLESAIYDWAYSAYGYGGAGDGTKYGDDILYDLVERTVSTQEWCMFRSEGEYTETPFDSLCPEERDED